MQRRRAQRWIVPLFGSLAVLNLFTRDYLGAAGWGFLTLSFWLREGGEAPPDRRRLQLSNAALGVALAAMVIRAVQLVQRVMG